MARSSRISRITTREYFMITGAQLEAALEELKGKLLRPDMSSSQDEIDRSYEGKLFYEVIKTGPQEFKVMGPFDNIYYISTGPGFVQVIDGKPVAMFTEDEIYVTKTPLVGGLSQLYRRSLE